MTLPFEVFINATDKLLMELFIDLFVAYIEIIRGVIYINSECHFDKPSYVRLV